MGKGIFITGGTGFIGRRVVEGIRSLGRPVFVLVRGDATSGIENVSVVRGTLLDPATYRDALASCDTVIHLAAATGRATPADHFEVNETGTKRLVEACRAAGVSRFLFVSSIATSFRNLNGYPYGQAKARAEELVRASGLRHLILRPTMVFGEGSPVQDGLEKIAALPIGVLPGRGRVLVQPVHVDDVARAIVWLVKEDRFRNDTLDAGGPDRLTMESLIGRMRRRRTGKPARLLHLWLPLMQAPLALAEAAGLGRLLPVTRGQLSSFTWDGIAAPSDLPPPRVDLTTMLAMAGGEAGVTRAALEAECRLLTKYLAGSNATDYVVTKYCRAHDVVPALREDVEDFLVAQARAGLFRARLADAYAAVFDAGGPLRRKLVLLLAILESTPPYFRTIDEAPSTSRWAAWLDLARRGLGSVLALAAGVVLLPPARIVWVLSVKGNR